MLFRPLFATVYIGINYDSTSCSVSVQKRRGGDVVEEKSTEFKILNYELSMEVIKFVKKIKNKYSFSYLSTASKTNNQFLIPTLQKSDYKKFGIHNEKDFKSLKILNSTIFIKKTDADDYSTAFKRMLGIDYLFSPFVLLYIKSKSILSDVPKLYVLQEKENSCVFVATKKSILYGNFLIINASEVTTSRADDLPPTKEHSKKLEENLDLGDDFDDLGELEDLDGELEDLDSFDFDFKESSSAGSLSALDNIQDLGRSTQIANILQNVIKDYYKNTLYDSQFLDEIMIYDCYGMSLQAMDNIRSNLMLAISFEQINLSSELVKLSNIQLNG